VPVVDPLLVAILGEPTDWSRYFVYADYLDEQGQGELAHAYRWMASRKLRPHERERYRIRDRSTSNWVDGDRVPDRFRWAWYREGDDFRWQPVDVPKYAVLPWLTAAAIRCRQQKIYAAWSEAVTDLASGLAAMNREYGIT
jgi:uncharacterized protein (TIGR02996 family)